MTDRKKRGVGFGISGLAFLLAAVVSFVVEADPSWLVPLLTIVGMVAGALGFTTVFPDTED
jgi:mannose/fructose/N-acetylgalactosamine-specific phosphotransferase system component IIC